MQHALAQEVDFCAAIHALFEDFEPVDLAFDLTVTPLQRDGRLDRLAIQPHPRGDTAQLRDRASLRPVKPRIQAVDIMLAHQCAEVLHQSLREGDQRAGSRQAREVGVFVGREVSAGAQQQPQRLARAVDGGRRRRRACRAAR